MQSIVISSSKDARTMFAKQRKCITCMLISFENACNDDEIIENYYQD